MHKLDINLICRNSASFIQETLDCLSSQTFGDFRVLALDDASTDETAEIIRKHAKKDKRFSYTRNAERLYVGNFQRAFTEGDAEYVMPKSADDLIDDTYVERCLGALGEDGALAMCHTASGIMAEGEKPFHPYDRQYNLDLRDEDPVTRALKAAVTYAVAPAYWGVYRRSATSKLAPIPFCNGFDHIVVCELALYGKITHIDDILFHRRKGGAPLAENARKATMQGIRDLSLNSYTSDFSYLTPLLAMIAGHVDMARVARIPDDRRAFLCDRLVYLLTARYANRIPGELRIFEQELTKFAAHLAQSPAAGTLAARLLVRNLHHQAMSIQLILGNTADVARIFSLIREMARATKFDLAAA